MCDRDEGGGGRANRLPSVGGDTCDAALDNFTAGMSGFDGAGGGASAGIADALDLIGTLWGAGGNELAGGDGMLKAVSRASNPGLFENDASGLVALTVACPVDAAGGVGVLVGTMGSSPSKETRLGCLEPRDGGRLGPPTNGGLFMDITLAGRLAGFGGGASGGGSLSETSRGFDWSILDSALSWGSSSSVSSLALGTRSDRKSISSEESAMEFRGLELFEREKRLKKRDTADGAAVGESGTTGSTGSCGDAGEIVVAGVTATTGETEAGVDEDVS